jgi:hypothetical protein
MDLQTATALPSGNDFDRYNDYTDQARSWISNEQANDPSFGAWQSEMSRYGAQDMDQMTPWTGRDYFSEWGQSLSPEQRADYNSAHSSVQADKAGSIKGILGKLAQGIPMAVAGAGLMGALGPSLSNLFSAAPEAASTASSAMNPVYGASKLPYTPFDVLGVGQSMGGVAAPAVEASMTAAQAAGGSGISDFFKGITDSIKEKPMSSLIGGARTLSSLGGLWSSYQQNQDYANLAGNLMSMYGDDSAYARQLRKELQRRDAASGRRSQYGPRSVELQAKLAELNSRNSGQLANIYQQQGVNRDNMVKSGLNIGKSTGLIDWLDNATKAPLAKLFGG